jgi:hypothetical protein
MGIVITPMWLTTGYGKISLAIDPGWPAARLLLSIVLRNYFI